MGMYDLRPRGAARGRAQGTPGHQRLQWQCPLSDGDCVVLIKDLPLKGAQVLKGGSKTGPIRLVDGDHEISCKIEGVGAVGLKACFVRKA